MFELEQIIEGCHIVIDDIEYRVLGKTFYVTEKAPTDTYAKILLDNHNVLVISPSDEIAYFGKNEGHIQEFDSYPETVVYRGVKYKMINHDYQIVSCIEFGSTLEIEGEVEYWDYEMNDMIVSIAVVSRTKKRADVVARYLSLDQISVK